MQSHELKEEIVHFMPPPQTCIIYSVACEMPHAFPIVLWAWGYQGISLNGERNVSQVPSLFIDVFNMVSAFI